MRGSLPQKDNHHEDDHSGASVVAFRVDGLCLDRGTCLRTAPGNLGAGGSFTSSPHLVGARCGPASRGAHGHHARISMGNVETERARCSVSNSPRREPSAAVHADDATKRIVMGAAPLAAPRSKAPTPIGTQSAAQVSGVSRSMKALNAASQEPSKTSAFLVVCITRTRSCGRGAQLETVPKKPWNSIERKSFQLWRKALKFLNVVSPAGTANFALPRAHRRPSAAICLLGGAGRAGLLGGMASSPLWRRSRGAVCLSPQGLYGRGGDGLGG